MQTDIIFEPKQRDNYLPYCTLNWRRRQLLVKFSEQVNQSFLSLLESEQYLVECLKHSPVRLVRLDPDLDKTVLKLWADACKQANKGVFLWVPPTHGLLKRKNLFQWRLKRLIDWSIAALLLLALSPVFLGLVLLISINSRGPIFSRRWCVGERGKLFQPFKFCTMANTEKPFPKLSSNQDDFHESQDAQGLSQFGQWMHRYGVEELPQLFNVLRGEMSLVGNRRALALEEAIHLSPERRQQLNALPGIIGVWQ